MIDLKPGAATISVMTKNTGNFKALFFTLHVYFSHIYFALNISKEVF